MTSQDESAEIVTDLEGWAALKEAWARCLSSAPGATAFQSHEFLRCWWDHFGGDQTPFVLALRETDRVLGIAPLQLVRRRILGRQYRVLEFMGMPDELDRPQFLVGENDRTTLEGLLDALAAHRDWDMIRLDELPAESWQLPVLEAWAERNDFRFRSEPLHPVPFLVKGGDWNWYVAQRSRRFAKRLRETERRLARDYSVSYRWCHGGEASKALLEDFLAVEYNSWKAYEGFDVGVEQAYRTFYEDLLCRESEALHGHVLVQYLDANPSAATLAFSSEGVYYSLQIAHDKAYERYSPGTLLEAVEMRWFFEQDWLRRYEFLGGGGGNKERWTKTSVDTRTVIIRRRSKRLALGDLSGRFLRPIFAPE